MKEKILKIVIIGGGAGGLELVTQLGDTLGKKKLAEIILVDKNLTHVWKPLWHEVAAGTLTSGENEINYIVHAYHHYFKFYLGEFCHLDRLQKNIVLNAVKDVNHHEILPQRILSYDMLIIAVGSISNDFNVPGVSTYCYNLDTYADCMYFHQQLVNNLIRIQNTQKKQLSICIIGGGATGIELAAELQFACQQALQYKIKDTTLLSCLQIKIIESSEKLLPDLPRKTVHLIFQELRARGIEIILNERVIKIEQNHIYTQNDKIFYADMKIWTAGIKAPNFLASLDLKTNKRNQLIVNQQLQTVLDDSIFAFGDCAACPQLNQSFVPPRAQAAHQQALLLKKSITRHLQGEHFLTFFYRDYGSLISITQQYALGNLMSGLVGNILLAGKIARLTYLLLYRRHQAAIYGWWTTCLITISQMLTRKIRPRIKLH